MKYFVDKSSEWQALAKHYEEICSVHLRDLFKDTKRFDTFSIHDPNLSLLIDYSKNRITDKTMHLLIDLAQKAQIKERIADMFSGKKINVTENRAVLHTALRNMSTHEILVDGQNIILEIQKSFDRVHLLSEQIRNGKWKGSSGKAIQDIVHIGIGGSDLGPRIVYEALRFYHNGPRVHFVANIDGVDIHEVVKSLKPETTLFIVASKSFTTAETLQNLITARAWLGKHDLKNHCIAITTNKAAAQKEGINEAHILPLWDFVGGRYSLWSAIGLSLACAFGFDRFCELLDGAHAADQHFLNTPYEKNIPIILAVLGVWYNNFFALETHAVIPYSNYLWLFPSYLQQLDMESNGKSVDMEGNSIQYQTGPIIWGAIGTNAQHSFFQLLHQGTKIVPLDFIGFKKPLVQIGEHHEKLMSNFFGQTKALAFGSEHENSYKRFEGNRPSTTFLFEQLTPRALGSLLALYEHKVFVQGLIWRINSFDQFGVELGKKIASDIFVEMSEKKIKNHDSSTQGLLKAYFNFS